MMSRAFGGTTRCGTRPNESVIACANPLKSIDGALDRPLVDVLDHGAAELEAALEPELDPLTSCPRSTATSTGLRVR